MKKGFTLIELLAVIVILAIIALIATPIILGIIEDARNESKVRSAELYLTAVEQAIVRKKMNNIGFNPSYCTIKKSVVTCEGMSEPLKVDVDGTKPSSGKITLSNGKVNKNETYMDFEKEQVSYDENGNFVLGISKEYEAIEIVRNYIKGIESEPPTEGEYFVCSDDPNDDIDEYPGAYNEASGGYLCDIVDNAPDVDKFPDGGYFGIRDGKVVAYENTGTEFYITYFTVGEYYVYFGADGELSATTLNLAYGTPYCVASNQLTYGVGLRASEGNPYAEGVEYKCTESFGTGPGEVIGFNEYFVLDVQGDKVKLISAVHSEEEWNLGWDMDPDYMSYEFPGPAYELIYGVNNSTDLSNSPWLTIQAPYSLYKPSNEFKGYYVSTDGIQEINSNYISLYEVKILEYNKSQLLH